MKQKRRNSTYFVVRTIKRRNRPRRFKALVDIRRDQRTPVVRLLGEPPRDPNQSSAPPVIDYNRFTPGKAKETHSMTVRTVYVFGYTHIREPQ